MKGKILLFLGFFLIIDGIRLRVQKVPFLAVGAWISVSAVTFSSKFALSISELSLFLLPFVFDRLIYSLSEHIVVTHINNLPDVTHLHLLVVFVFFVELDGIVCDYF